MPQPTVLIADDDTALINLMSAILKPLDVNIQTAHDALSALTTVHAHPPDLVILDVNMPSGNGLSVCEMLATDSQFQRMPVIIFTGEGGHARVRSLALGASYIQKGIDALPELKLAVDRTLSEIRGQSLQSQLFLG